ncbi:hypothetical protein C3489_13560 [Streptomyces sp. Ru71]|uniref:hypothetical protein n=1 Tax=Streptomyces sp. Ru71 TaxID=2080746 RepID=UPI000CDD0526|nr:hypothetical protein [Streptomyces sp. Ru71]POX54490.1 hypothetical protein C3489_13560 [Streptomyces sp. Ru71]
MTWNRADGRRADEAPLEVACDESGSDGENLVGGNTDVFAHAGVALPIRAAEVFVQEIRDRIRSPAEEYKANHLLREKHRAVLEWLLAPAGPLAGRARVHLTQKAYFVVEQAVRLLLGDGDRAARALFRAGPGAFGDACWQEFLGAANRLLRVRYDGDPRTPVAEFYRVVERMREAEDAAGSPDVPARLAETRSRAEAYRDRLLDGPPLVPVLNPLLPAIVRTAASWSDDGRPVLLVHDRQNMLTEDRIAWIVAAARRRGAGLTGLRLVAARQDARVQLADFLAGVARKIASDELNGHGDPVLTALLRPFVAAESVWGDEESWSRLGPGTEIPGVPARLNFAV